MSYTYDPLNRVKTVTTDPTGALPATTVGYAYDKVGNRSSLSTDYGLPTTDYAYDVLNRLTEIRNPQSTIAQFGYDALSRRTSLARANGTSTAYAYDAANRLTQLTGSLATANRQYTYDTVGNRRTMTDPAGLHTYTYDPLDQLTNTDTPVGFTFADTTYTYDAVGNRLQTVDGGTTLYTPNPLNQYTDVNGTTFSYDPGIPVPQYYFLLIQTQPIP